MSLKELRQEYAKKVVELYGEELFGDVDKIESTWNDAPEAEAGQFYNHGYLDFGWKIYLSTKWISDDLDEIIAIKLHIKG